MLTSTTCTGQASCQMLSELQLVPTLVNKATAYKTAWKRKQCKHKRDRNSIQCSLCKGWFILFVHVAMTLPEANLFAEIANRLYMYHVELCITFVNSSPLHHVYSCTLIHTCVYSRRPVYNLVYMCVLMYTHSYSCMCALV